MKILLFGGTRFMGRYVAREVLAAGWQLTVLNRGTRPAVPGVECIACDRGAPGALAVLEGRSFDAVIDFSAYASDWVAQAGALLEGRIRRYLFISSCAVYTESQTLPVTEDAPTGPPHPHQAYAAEKLRSERLLQEFGRRGAFQTVSCRLPFVLGPDNYEDRESFVFSRLHAGAPILLTNGGNALYSFVYAGDVAQALMALIRADDRVDGQIFNITMPQATTGRGFVEACAGVAGKTPKLVHVPQDALGFTPAEFDLRDLCFPFPHHHFFASGERLRQSIGFAPRHTLHDMLRIYHADWLSRGDLAPRVYPREQSVLARLAGAEPGA